MSFYHQDEDVFYNNLDESAENQIQFLKLKLIQTHQKLLKELENNKHLEAKLNKNEIKNQQVLRENQNLSSKISSILLRAEKNKHQMEKMKTIEMNLVQAERRNEILTEHLQNLRKKLQIIVEEKAQHQQQSKQKQAVINTLKHQNQQLITKLKNLETVMTDINEKKENLKKKHDQMLNQNNAIGQQLNEMKQIQFELSKKIQQYNHYLKVQREKNAKLENQLKICSSELRDYKVKYDKAEQACDRLKDQVYWLQNKNRNEVKGTSEQLEKLTAELNHVTSILKQKQRELEHSKKKPTKKKENWENVKQLVMKLEDQQQKVLMDKSPQRNSYTQNKFYRQEKQDYINMISEVSDLESTLLKLNLQRKKFLSEMDKIDNTKVKTKDMISRRRKIEDDVNKIEHQIDSVKLQMRKLKVI